MSVEQVFRFGSSSQSCDDSINGIYDLGCVKFGTDEIQCRWTIIKDNNWPKVGEVKSPTFWHKGSTEWCMELSVEEGNWFLSFHLLSSQKEAWEKATVRASLCTKKNYKEVYNDTVSLGKLEANRFRKSTKKICIISNSSFSSGNSNDFIEEIKLLGIVSIASSMMEPSKKVVLYTDTECVINDLGALMDSGDQSDIVLCAGSTKLKAHRAVLSARSPVFAAMLRHDTEEAQMGNIDIPDIDPDTLREVLNYIYTGRAPLIKKMADKLLVAADKYGLLKLKEWCEIELTKNLTVDNAILIAVSALEHSCDFLKPAVINFIKSNIIRVMSSKGWADTVTQNSKIVLEISDLLADKP